MQSPRTVPVIDGRRKAKLAAATRGKRHSLAITLILTAIFVSIALSSLPATAQTYQVIYNFSWGSNGRWPWSELTLGPGGHLYGTTMEGGSSQGFFCDYGCGLVYDLYQKNSYWIYTPLHEFLSSDGTNPHSGVTFGPDGALYGTTLTGGLQYSDCDVAGCGTVYRLQPSANVPRSPLLSWNLNVVRYFTGGDNDGGDPSTTLVMDQGGNLYGGDGGGPDNCGLIFQLSRNSGQWNFNEIYNGFYCPDGNVGIGPGGLVVDNDGNLYGVTAEGGHPYCSVERNGCGTIFKLTHTDSGWVETTLYEFSEATDGAVVNALIRDAAGNLYGGTQTSGPGGGGTVWELSPNDGGSWRFRVLYSFQSTELYAGPIGRLAMDAAGNLYGVTQSEGLYGEGNVFKLAPSGDGGWNYSSLHDFDGYDQGAFPLRGPTVDSNNNLYGTAYYGGSGGGGVVWEITP